MKILTANIAWGLRDMDRFRSSVGNQLGVIGVGILVHQLSSSVSSMIGVHPAVKRVAYLQKHKDLEPTFDMVRRVQPDILVLNEVVFELYRDEVEAALRGAGFHFITWGLSKKYPGTSLSVVIATKSPSVAIACDMPQEPRLGGGVGIAGVRLPRERLSVIGFQMAYNVRELWKRQLSALAHLTRTEQSEGFNVVLAGDWNEEEPAITRAKEFQALNLLSGDLNKSPTCATFLPRFMQKSLDHIFIPDSWKVLRSEAIAFRSDHLALLVEVQPH